jgi:hypothetical protein
MKICQNCRKAREPGSLSLRKELEELSHRNAGGGKSVAIAGSGGLTGSSRATEASGAGSHNAHHLVPIQIFDVGYGKEWKPSRLAQQQLQLHTTAAGGEKSRGAGRGKYRQDDNTSDEMVTTVGNSGSSSSSAENSDSSNEADLNLWSIGSLSMWNALAPPPPKAPPAAATSSQHQQSAGEQVVGSSVPVLTLTLPSHTVWFDENKAADKEYSTDY